MRHRSKSKDDQNNELVPFSGLDDDHNPHTKGLAITLVIFKGSTSLLATVQSL